MMSISLNPGFVLLAAALFVWALPRALRAVVLAVAAFAALAVPFMPAFGEHAAFGQFGLKVVPLRLDALSQIFGLGLAILALMAALASGVRDRRGEDAMLCLLAGGALAAVYAGDLVTLVASLSLAAFAVVGLAFTAAMTVEARAAARRIMIWMVIASLLLTAGAGVFLGEAKSVRFDAVGADNFGGVLLLLGLAVLAGAPGAHVWLRDAAVRLTPTAACLALTAAPMAAVYGFARAYPGEPALCWIGVGAALGAAVLATAADDVRKAMAYAAVSFWGGVVGLVGVDAPQGLGGAAGLAFAGGVALSGCILAVGTAALASRTASARALAAGEGRAMPLTALLFAIFGLSLVGWPGLAGHVARAFALDAAADFGPTWVWPCLLAAAAILAGGIVARITLLLLAPSDRHATPTPVEPPLLALALGFAVSVWVGLSPDWLLNLIPPEPARYNPYQAGDLLSIIQTLASGAAAWAILRALGVAPIGGRPVDLDVVWRGLSPPLGRMVHAVGAALSSRVERAWIAFGGLLARSVWTRIERLTRMQDGPTGVFAAVAIAIIAGVLICTIFVWSI